VAQLVLLLWAPCLPRAGEKWKLGSWKLLLLLLLLLLLGSLALLFLKDARVGTVEETQR
jgi:hypothetical protein